MPLIIKKINDPQTQSLANAIRVEVFVKEQLVPEALEYEFEDESRHYLALFDGMAAGTARWRKTAKGIKLERFAVLKNLRGHGVASALLQQILTDIAYEPFIYLHAQAGATGFYQRHGFEIKGEMFLEAGIEHYEMHLNK